MFPYSLRRNFPTRPIYIRLLWAKHCTNCGVFALKGKREWEEVGRVRERRLWVMELPFDAKMFFSLALLGFVGLLVRLYKALVVTPEKLRSQLREQGISGPPPTLLLGNIREIKKARSTSANGPATGDAPESHNCAAVLFPFFDQWRKQYGMF